MRLDELIAGLPVDVHGPADVAVRDVVEDSRRVHPGDLFVARAGNALHGNAFVADAAERGAMAVLIERAAAVDVTGPTLLRTDDPAAVGAVLAERQHGRPSAQLVVVAVTGTNGKTTMASLVHQILVTSGMTAGLMGTVSIDEGRGPAGTPSLTTPGASDVSRYLGQMVANGCRACVMEVSSHALDQGRTAALRISGAVFTNLSGDHLDYHGDMDAYAAAKARLFAAVPPDGWAVVNIDDPAARVMTDAARCSIVTTSLDDHAADAHAQSEMSTIRGAVITCAGPWGVCRGQVPLVGRHNAMNVLQAVVVAWRLGLTRDDIERGLAGIAPPPGRLEMVPGGDGAPCVLVDYAHTDDALDNVLSAVRPLVPGGGKLVTVFGCGGDRDRAKRPRMAAAAWRWSDRVHVTSDNPRTEDPAAIIAEIVTGIPASHRAETRIDVDRRSAIAAAIAGAAPGDVVVIAGKGHEDYQIVGTERLDFDDRRVAAAAIAARGAAAKIAPEGAHP